MVNTIAVLGPNGNVGSRIVPHLLAAHRAGKLNLVLLHRPGSPPKNVPTDAGVDIREIDLSGDFEGIKTSVRGLNGLVSAISIAGVAAQLPLIGALAQTPGFVTFIPPGFSIPLNDEDLPALPFMQPYLETGDKLKGLGVGTTDIKGGLFELVLLGSAWGFNVKGNTLTASDAQLRNGVPFTTLAHLGKSVADILTGNLDSVANKSFSVVTQQPTGQQILDAFSATNGSKAKRNDHTPEAQAELLTQVATGGSFEAVYRRHWENNDWKLPPLYRVDGEESIEDIVRRAAGK